MADVKQMTDDEFELECHRQTYLALAANPLKFNLSPTQIIKPAEAPPFVKCPCCEMEVVPDTLSLVVACPKCPTNLLIIVPPPAVPPKNGKSKKAK